MKRLLYLFTLCAILAGCNNEDTTLTPTEGLSIEDSQLAITVSGDEGSGEIRFTAYENWYARIESTTPSNSGSWCKLSPSSGQAGSIILWAEVKENTTGADRSATILLKAGNVEKTITVSQLSQEILNPAATNYVAKISGDEIAIEITSNAPVTHTINKDDQSWILPIGTTSAPSATRASAVTTTARFQILPHTEFHRVGTITFASTSLQKAVTITQTYTSTDLSANGKVLELQKATEGNGINVVLMGDAFSDRLIADGTYEKTMKKAMESFFAKEPYKTFRNLFNIYAVVAVSTNEGYFTGAKTALEGFFGEGTIVGGNDDKCKSYAYKIPGMTSIKMDDLLFIIMMNKEMYAGTCYQYEPINSGDYGRGTSFAYFPLGTDDAMFDILLTHEAGGHGFGKLTDEYSYPSMGRIPQSEIEYISQTDAAGWNKNVDFTSDPKMVKWSKFIADERYTSEGISVFEGACIYPLGAYRPTMAGIMNNNTGGFNAPSREAIYYRIHKLAYGRSWPYDYETFVAYDAVNRTEDALRAARSSVPYNYPPLATPVIRQHTL